jgi:apolipoprotein N-acyltransferase
VTEAKSREPKPARKRKRPGARKPQAAVPAEAPLLSGRWAYGLALLSGLLYFLAFPGMEVWPLSFVALVPLVLALHGQRPRRGAALGWVAGFTMTMLGFYWLMGMLQEFSGFPTVICLLLMALLCAYQAGRIALCGWLFSRAQTRGWPPKLGFALAFGASELVYPLVFPWTYAATVHDVPALTQTAELWGPIGVALVLVAANLGIAELVLARLQHRRAHFQVVGALVAVPVVAAVYGAIRIPQVDAATRAAPKARVGVVQANLGLMQKRTHPAEGLQRHLDLTRRLQQEHPLDLVVWPETSVIGAVYEKGAYRLLRQRVTQYLGVPAIFGSVLLRPVDDVRKRVAFNSALLSDKRGFICDSCRYDKQYLLAFGEYLPLGNTFPVMYQWSPNSGRFSPGTSLRPLPLGDREIAVFICYEDIIPAFVNSIVRSGKPDLLVNITNDAWFGDTTEPWIHLALAKLRAVEHRRFLVRATNSGVSAIVDPVGRVVANTGTFIQDAVSAEVAWLRPTTIFGVIGNTPWYLVSLASLVLAFAFRRPRTKTSHSED